MKYGKEISSYPVKIKLLNNNGSDQVLYVRPNRKVPFIENLTFGLFDIEDNLYNLTFENEYKKH